MKIVLMTKSLVSIGGALVLLASVKALAFMPLQSAVDECVRAVEQKYTIAPQYLELDTVRARTIGNAAAMIYLRTRPKASATPQRAKMYCTIDKHDKVARLRASPRLLDVPE